MANPASAKRQKRDDWIGDALNEARRYAPQALALMTPAGQAIVLHALLSEKRKQAATKPVTAPSAKAAAAPREPGPARVLEPIGRFAYQQLTRRDPVSKAVAGYVTRELVKPVGRARGALHAIEDAAAAADFTTRVRNPVEAAKMGVNAWENRDQLLDQASAVVDTITHPREGARRAADAVHKFWVDHDHWATPQGDKVAAEIIRNIPIAVNDGELEFDVISTLRGGPVTRAIVRGAPMTEARWLAKGVPPNKAKVYAKPYAYDGRNRRGHHSPVAVNSPVGKRLSKKLLDSPFNVVTYDGLTIGEAIQHHFGADRHVKGGKIGGVRWRGKDPGLRRYALEERLWHGTPEATRDLIISGLLGPVLLNDAPDTQRERRE